MKSIIVIDDTNDVAEDVERMCHDLDTKVARSPDPLHGIMRAVSCDPALILVAAHLTWLGSLPVKEAARLDKRLRTVPVLTVVDGRHTAESQHSEHVSGTRPLHWPDEREELARRLRQLAGRASAPAAAVSGHVTPERTAV